MRITSKVILWKDLKNEEGCDNCPLLKEEICPGGWTCYGSEPIEPPCCSFNDDTDINQWIADYFDGLQREEERETARIKEEQKRKERAKKAADTRRAMQWYCQNEIYELKQAKKALQAQLNLENVTQRISEAVNFANEAFHYKERTVVNPQISEETKLLQIRVDQADAVLQAKKKQFYREKKDGENNGGSCNKL